MAKIKNIFKIILALQLVAYTLATYGHPDAETIDFISSTQPSRDKMLIEAAIQRGMNGEAVAELLRTKKPVTKVTNTPDGFTKTTTYTLEPDGTISSKTVSKKRNRYIYNADTIPEELKNSPTGTVTRTYTDAEGNKVTETITIKNNSPGIETDDLNGDNSYNRPSLAYPENPGFTTGPRTTTRTFFTANQGKMDDHWPYNKKFLDSVKPLSNSATRSYISPTGQIYPSDPEAFDRAYRPKYNPLDDPFWDGFAEPSLTKPSDNDDDTDGWEVVGDPEVTTSKTFESWTPKTWHWPEFPKQRTAATTLKTTTATPKLYLEPEPSTPKPRQSLDDFLRSQYGKPTIRDPTTTTTTAKTYSPKSFTITTTPKYSTSTTTKIINIDDLPVMEVLHNGKPADESILRTLPPHLTPRSPTEQILHIEHKYPLPEEELEAHTPKVDTRTHSYSTTLIGPEKPKLKDLDPSIQNILKNAGIIPELEGDNITKQRTEPDGRIITTTYKVNTIPNAQHYAPPQISTHSFHSYKSDTALPTLLPHSSSISEFLAQLGMTKADITSRNGHSTKTIIDENGDILTVTFNLRSA